MTKRSCPTSGCGALTEGGYCPRCTRERDRARGTTSERGYGPKHRALRAEYQQRMDEGETFHCWRCGHPVNPGDWHLGHDDHDRSKYRGPECPSCNQATAGRRPQL